MNKNGRKEMKLKRLAALLLCAAVMLPLSVRVRKKTGFRNIAYIADYR